MSAPPTLLLDLDGTLVDSVYAHVLAWRDALAADDMSVPCWVVHRRIGMGSDLFARAALRDAGHPVDDERVSALQSAHGDCYARYVDDVLPFPGAAELLAALDDADVRWAIATSSRRASTTPMLERLGVGDDATVVTGEEAEGGKPDPDLFIAAAEQLGVRPADCMVVGDSIWDLLSARRCGALGVGLRTGGFPDAELVATGSYRVYDDPADLHRHLDELGIRLPS